MSTPLRVLFVDDSEDDAMLTLLALRRGGYQPTSERVDEADALRAALQGRSWDLVVCDWFMPRLTALDALAIAREFDPGLPCLVVSGTVGEETAIAALHAGALDFLAKGKLTRLIPAVQRALREREARAARLRAEDALRRSEEQLRQAQKMEAIGRLAGGIAHDFNNLLSVILSYAGLVISELEQGDAMRGDIEEIQKAGKRAAELTRQLLAFTRQEVQELRILDVNSVLMGLDRMLRRIVGEDIDMLVHAAKGLAKVYADRGQVEQVVMNLVVNARDAMPKGGKLTLETANVELDDEYAKGHLGATPGPHVMLAVTDTGVGMDKATMERIFEPFFTTKGVGKGTGLGLSTVHGIVQQSGGNLWVYSEPGKGTTFKVYFPAASESRIASEPPPASVKDPPRGTETILLVEDDEQVRRATRGILERCGYRVLEAASEAEALRVCQQRRRTIHLLLTDVVLPQASGADIAQKVRARRPTTKVLFMSGYTGEAVVHHGVLGSDYPFIQKPLTPESLARKVREVLDGE